jgi:hypothetical protein
MDMIILTFIIAGLGFWFHKRTKHKVQPKTKPPESKKGPDKATIQIVVENKQVKKDQIEGSDEIISEAEAHFRTLQQKHLYSPIPFKVLGEFYIGKGLHQEAINKYRAMLPYLNQELDLTKVEPILAFLRDQNEETLATKILEKYS